MERRVREDLREGEGERKGEGRRGGGQKYLAAPLLVEAPWALTPLLFRCLRDSTPARGSKGAREDEREQSGKEKQVGGQLVLV